MDISEIDDIYTPLEEAKKEIWRRWNDKELRKKVEEFLGGDIPEPFRKEPRAVLFRNIITADFEACRFFDLTRDFGIKPLGWEYLDDAFCTRNDDKLNLGRLPILKGVDKNKKYIVYYKKVINLMKSDNQKFCNIKTIDGENIINFHHKLVKNISDIEIQDGSDWITKKGRKAKDYYKYLFGLFVSNGILFENFLLNKDENEFTREIVKPAFKKVERQFGLKPLIVELLEKDKATDMYWWCYPGNIEKNIK